MHHSVICNFSNLNNSILGRTLWIQKKNILELVQEQLASNTSFNMAAYQID